MKVTANVLLRDPKTGTVTVINAGEEAPEWATGLLGSHVTGKPEAKASDKDADAEDGGTEPKAEKPKPAARRGRR